MDDNKIKLLNLLGLANKGGKIVRGEDSVIALMRKGSAKIVFVASDSSEKTIENFKRKCYFYKVPCTSMLTSDEISMALGRFNKIIALNDANFYSGIVKYIEVDK